MQPRRVAPLLWTLGFVAALVAGCGASYGQTGGQTILDQTPLEQVGKMLRTYQKGLKPPTKGARDFPVYKPGPVPPPRGLKDLAPMAKGFPHAVNALRSGDVLLFWKTDLADDPDAASTLLAYASEVPNKGGQVLMKNGTVQTMTSAQFQAARKPEGATTDDPSAAPSKK